jgi:hypothetical protein
MKHAQPFSLPVIAAAVTLAASLASPSALAQVYRCESDTGVPVYQGSPSGKNCRALDMAPLTTIPAPKLPAGAGKPSAPATGLAGTARPAASAGTPADFPRVDASTQRSRDGERRSILEAELSKEENRLESLRREYNDGQPERLGSERNYQKYLDRVERLKEDIARSEANIGSLQRELAAIRE